MTIVKNVFVQEEGFDAELLEAFEKQLMKHVNKIPAYTSPKTVLEFLAEVKSQDMPDAEKDFLIVKSFTHLFACHKRGGKYPKGERTYCKYVFAGVTFEYSYDPMDNQNQEKDFVRVYVKGDDHYELLHGVESDIHYYLDNPRLVRSLLGSITKFAKKYLAQSDSSGAKAFTFMPARNLPEGLAG